MYYPRKLKSILKSSLRSFPAVLITGPRQSGKTTLVQNELKNKASYITFDDPLQRSFAHSDPNGFLDQFKNKPVILDEIQYVPGLLPYIKIRIDSARNRNGIWILTGSQQFHLMKDISESLAGRIAILELLPFSSAEGKKTKTVEKVQTALWYGGYPDVKLKPSQRELWLRSYIQTYIERDVRQLQNIRNMQSFETFLNLSAAFHGSSLNYAKIAGHCGISQPAVKDWLKILSASYVIHLLQPYHSNFGKRITKTPRLYFLDSALAAYLTRQPSQEALWAGAMGGAFFEGWVVSEAIKVYTNLGKRPEIYFWHSHDGTEVDLLLEGRQGLFAVEIKQTATPSPKHGEGLNRFEKFCEGRPLAGKALVCGISENTKLPHGTLAVSWKNFPSWLEGVVK